MHFSGENDLRWGVVKWYYGLMAEHGPGVPEGFPDAGNRVWDPQAIVRQVRSRLVGRKQTKRGKKAVTGADGETDTSRSRLFCCARNKMKRDIIDTLRRHFGCLDEQVTCSRVKPFLPGLLIPILRIRIPTPITVHIDHCPECADDLKALGDLGLSPAQLERLERLYDRAQVLTDAPSQNSVASTERDEKTCSPAAPGWGTRRTQPGAAGLPGGSGRLSSSGISSGGPLLRSFRQGLGERWQCRRARAKIAAFVRGRIENIDGAILNHLCTCPRCRVSAVTRSR